MWIVPGNSTLSFLEKLRSFKFSLILLRTVNEFTKTPSFWGIFERATDGGIPYETIRGSDASGGGPGEEGLAYQFVKPFRVLLLGHHPAIIKDFQRSARV